MSTYFFDFRSGDVISRDEVGQELPDLEAAYAEALQSLADVFSELVQPGAPKQQVVLEVRDDLGPVLEMTALLGARILRKQ